MSLRRIDLEKRLRTLARAKPIEWWRLVYDAAVALFIKGFPRQAGDLWALTIGPDLPPPQSVSRQHAFDEYLPPLVHFVIGGPSAASLEGPARRTDHWNRMRLTLDQWAQPVARDEGGLPDFGSLDPIEM